MELLIKKRVDVIKHLPQKVFLSASDSVAGQPRLNRNFLSVKLTPLDTKPVFQCLVGKRCGWR